MLYAIGPGRGNSCLGKNNIKALRKNEKWELFNYLFSDKIFATLFVL